MRSTKPILTCLLALIACTACSTTSSIAQRAANGDAKAQFEYGRRLLLGKDCTKDPARALVWFHTSAALGNTKAMLAIGLCHEKGLGTSMDKKKARQWYNKAAASGSQDAGMQLVGMDMKSGHIAEAVMGLDLLSQHRNTKATSLLIKRFMDPKSPHYNPAKGITYVRFAAMDGSKEAAGMLSYCYTHGLGVPKNPVLAQGWKNWKK